MFYTNSGYFYKFFFMEVKDDKENKKSIKRFNKKK